MPVTLSDPGGGTITVAPEATQVRVTGSVLSIAINPLPTTVEIKGTSTALTLWAFANVAFHGGDSHPTVGSTPHILGAQWGGSTGRWQVTTDLLTGKTWELDWSPSAGTEVQNVTLDGQPVPGANFMSFFFFTRNAGGAAFAPSNGQIVNVEFLFR